MCIPTRKLSPSFSKDKASSKSFASTGSIVKVKTSLMSLRFDISLSLGKSGIRFASSSIL